jgi:uncharacterized protein DUF6587
MMDTGLVVQYVVIAVAVVASAAFVAQKQFPVGVRRLRIALAVPLVRNGRATWVQRLGHWLAPAPRLGEGSCGECHSCDTGHS